MDSVIPPDLAGCRIINAAGTLTRLSGAVVSDKVAAAMSAAAQSSFDIWSLQAAASARISEATGAEAGLVTTGASAGLTLAAAAVIAGNDVARMQALPHSPGLASEILVPRTHRNGYDRALTVAGAKLVDVGTADRETDAGIRGLETWEIETAITPRTVALLGNASSGTERDLPVLADVARRRGLPLIVDAAAQLPPVINLRQPLETGATLVVYSGGKAIGGPQASGILAGRRDLHRLRRVADARHGCDAVILFGPGCIFWQSAADCAATTRHWSWLQGVERSNHRADGGAGRVRRPR